MCGSIRIGQIGYIPIKYIQYIIIPIVIQDESVIKIYV